jgi:hypothetical protein
MHYKDGTPAILGDIVQSDAGLVGIVIGGTIGSDFCSTQIVAFESAEKQYGCSAFVGVLRKEGGKPVATGSVKVALHNSVQTRECVKIGHVDIGHG